MPPGVTRWPAPGSWTPSRSRAPTPSRAHSRGYDAGKKVNGRKRHIVVDTLGLLIVVLVTAASLQDRDGGRRILDRARMAMPSIALVWADGGYAGKLVAWVARYCRIVLEIVRKPEGQRTFEVLPRRWVVERTLSWLVRWRRLDRDYERLPTHSEAMVKWAMIGLMARRLAPPPGRRPWATGPCPVNPFPNTFLEISQHSGRQAFAATPPIGDDSAAHVPAAHCTSAG